MRPFVAVLCSVVVLVAAISAVNMLSGSSTTAPPGQAACAAPSDVEGIDLTGWKVTLPTAQGEVSTETEEPEEDSSESESSSAEPAEIEQPDLTGFIADPWFVPTEDCTGIRFRSAVNGVTTANSLNPRSELREMIEDGSNEAEWSVSQGTHTMTVRGMVTHLPEVKPHVVAAQVHGGSDDLTAFRLEGSSFWVTDGDETHGQLITDSYELGTPYELRFVAGGGEIQAYFDGQLVTTIPSDSSTAYFKTGAYTQAHCENSDPCDETNYGETVICGVEVTHEGTTAGPTDDEERAESESGDDSSDSAGDESNSDDSSSESSSDEGSSESSAESSTDGGSAESSSESSSDESGTESSSESSGDDSSSSSSSDESSSDDGSNGDDGSSESGGDGASDGFAGQSSGEDESGSESSDESGGDDSGDEAGGGSESGEDSSDSESGEDESGGDEASSGGDEGSSEDSGGEAGSDESSSDESSGDDSSSESSGDDSGSSSDSSVGSTTPTTGSDNAGGSGDAGAGASCGGGGSVEPPGDCPTDSTGSESSDSGASDSDEADEDSDDASSDDSDDEGSDDESSDDSDDDSAGDDHADDHSGADDEDSVDDDSDYDVPTPAGPIPGNPNLTGFAGSRAQDSDEDDSGDEESDDEESDDEESGSEEGSSGEGEDSSSDDSDSSSSDDSSSSSESEADESTDDSSSDDSTSSESEAGESTDDSGATDPCDSTREPEPAPEPAPVPTDDGTTGSGSAEPVGGPGRIAYAADGNAHDPDDHASSAMALAILAQQELQPNLVNYTYSNHISEWGETDSEMAAIMAESVTGSAERFGFEPSVFFDASTPEGLDAGVADLTADINASTADDELTIALAGPMETAWMALDAADAEARTHVRCVSHGDGSHNQTHGAEHGGHTYDDVIDLGCQRVQIPDQNGNLGPTDMSDWDYLQGTGDPNMEWLHERLEAAGGIGDVSDAGMIYFATTGNEEGTRDDLQSLLTGSGGSGSDDSTASSSSTDSGDGPSSSSSASSSGDGGSSSSSSSDDDGGDSSDSGDDAGESDGGESSP